jgi:hypothetical protein
VSSLWVCMRERQHIYEDLNESSSAVGDSAEPKLLGVSQVTLFRSESVLNSRNWWLRVWTYATRSQNIGSDS